VGFQESQSKTKENIMAANIELCAIIKNSSMNIKQYFERINYVDSIDLAFETLSKLQLQHLLHVPFENLDIHNNTPIDLNNLFDKIVTRKEVVFAMN